MPSLFQGFPFYLKRTQILKVKAVLIAYGANNDIENNEFEATPAWYRTNDNSRPFQIRLQDVSKYGYVVLYKRKDIKQ